MGGCATWPNRDRRRQRTRGEVLDVDNFRLAVTHFRSTPRVLRVDLITLVGLISGWLRGTVVERRSSAGVLSLSCARPVADG